MEKFKGERRCIEGDVQMANTAIDGKKICISI